MSEKQGWLIYQEEEIQRNQFSIRVMCENAECLEIPLEVRSWQWWNEWKSARSMNPGREYGKNGNSGNFRRNSKLNSELPDYVINRSRDAYLAEWFEEKGIHVFNSSLVTRIGNDKEETLKFAEALHIPTLEWRDGTTLQFATLEQETGEKTYISIGERKEREASFPLVAKSCSGHGGTEVFWVENETDLARVKQSLTGKKWMLQRPASELGKDVRVYAVGQQIIQAMLRVSETDFRSNFCLGGRAEPYELSEKERQMVEKILMELKSDYVGIDFLFDQGRLVLNEIEDAVGARMLYSGTDLDILKLYIEHIKRVIGM